MTAAGTTSTGQPRYQLDVFRAVAALSVAMFHAYQFNRREQWPLEGTFWHDVILATDLFVAMFFLLSGFLLGLPIMRASLGAGPLRPSKAFLIKRFARLVPTYYIVVLLVWSLTNVELPGHWQDLVLHLTFTQVYSDEYIFWTNGPAWSLANEMHYYLLLAVLAGPAHALCARLATRRARIGVLVGGVAALVAVSVGYKLVAWLVWQRPQESWSTWFGPLAKLDVFALGMLVAIGAAAGVRVNGRWVRLGVAVAGAGVVVLGESSPRPFQHTVLAIGAGMIIAAAVITDGPVPRLLSWRPLVAVGLSSYSIYLWHEPLLRFLSHVGLDPFAGTAAGFVCTTVLLMIVVIPVGQFSYRFIERTGMKLAAAFDARGRPREYYSEVTVRG
ncbi:putative acyltransferase [Prauserella sp. Am3]|nr:putative acyltransferase [Prauserella sp. Am3]